MISSALALAPVLVDDWTGASGNSRSVGIETLQQATRDDYDRWLTTALAAGGCVRPVRLRGTVRDVDIVSGEVLDGLDTEDLPDKAIYVLCGDRRASVFPPCAETYRADTYALVARSAGHFAGWGEVVIFAACTAARIGEVSGVRGADIDRDTWTWTARRQTTPGPGGVIDKGTKGRARTVPLIEEVRPLVERHLESVGVDPMARLFTGP
jgi:hypothetical protein